MLTETKRELVALLQQTQEEPQNGVVCVRLLKETKSLLAEKKKR